MNRQRALIGEITALIPTAVTGPWRKPTFNRSDWLRKQLAEA